MSGAVKFVKDVRRLATTFLTGSVLYVDPASGGSGGSKPGWAYTEAGVLVASGTVSLPRGDITTRLVDLLAQLTYPVFKYGTPDLLVVEELRGRLVHPFLHWSVGVTVAAVHAEAVLEIPITCWKALAERDADYVKDDEADARKFAETCLLLAGGGVLLLRSRGVAGRTRRARRAPAAKGRKRSKRAAATRTSRVRATGDSSPGRNPQGPRRGQGKKL